jgi:hypothetical protein
MTTKHTGQAFRRPTILDLRGIRLFHPDGDGSGAGSPAATPPAAPAAGAAPDASLPGTDTLAGAIAAVGQTGTGAPPAAAPQPQGPAAVPPAAAPPAPPGTPPAGEQPVAPVVAGAGATTAEVQAEIEQPLGPVAFKDLDPRTQAEVRNLRTEARDRRLALEAATTGQQSAVDAALEAERRRLGLALGLIEPEAPTTPSVEELVSTNAADRATIASQAGELAVLRNAPLVGGDANRLLDSKEFEKTLAGVNLADATAVQNAIRDFVQKNETYRTAPPIGGSSGTGGAGNGGATGPDTSSLHGAIAAQIATQRGA